MSSWASRVHGLRSGGHARSANYGWARGRWGGAILCAPHVCTGSGYRPKSNWEISVRWSYFGGKPYTPINLESSTIYDEQLLYINEFNEQKTPDYHSLFIRYEKRYSLRKSNLILFFEIWNTYNRENIETFFYSRDRQSIEKIVYFSTIPVGGFGIEF